jgi:hypothetical protein
LIAVLEFERLQSALHKRLPRRAGAAATIVESACLENAREKAEGEHGQLKERAAPTRHIHLLFQEKRVLRPDVTVLLTLLQFNYSGMASGVSLSLHRKPNHPSR